MHPRVKFSCTFVKITNSMYNVFGQPSKGPRNLGEISSARRDEPSIATPRAGYIYKPRRPGTPAVGDPARTSQSVPQAIHFKPRTNDSRAVSSKYQTFQSTQLVNFSRLLVELKCKIIRTRKSLQMRPVTAVSTQSYEAMFNRFRSNQRARNRQTIPGLNQYR